MNFLTLHDFPTGIMNALILLERYHPMSKDYTIVKKHKRQNLPF